ncbi:MAG: DUF4926 domain-containing protein [Phototrophicales bacterium]|nr:DUF4926 domain-containing protein [Phototrophicales bacterium]
MINELDRVVLTIDLPEHGLKAGDIGMVAHVYGDPLGYEIEFVTLTGDFVALVAMYPHQIRPIAQNEIAHIRIVNAMPT